MGFGPGKNEDLFPLSRAPGVLRAAAKSYLLLPDPLIRILTLSRPKRKKTINIHDVGFCLQISIAYAENNLSKTEAFEKCSFPFKAVVWENMPC
ncbi:MAG: hypothetical protein AB1427_13990 [Thermodesulfobacteriota bacterium]